MIEIIIPTYNNKETLPRTLYSLMAQTDQNFKVLIVDDCSQDDIFSIFNEFKNKLDIRYIRNKKNLGIGMTRQVGIDNAIGDYITFLDSDDVFFPYTISIFNTSLEKRPGINLLFTHFYEEETFVSGYKDFSLHDNDNYFWCHGKLYKIDFLKQFNIVNTPEVLVNDDVYFNILCIELSEVLTIPVPTMIWMENKKSASRQPSWMERKTSDLINAYMLSISFLTKYKTISEINYLPNSLEYLKKFYKTKINYLSLEE
jgi:glycosyltransferase involved in cell wall biosynthesis